MSVTLTIITTKPVQVNWYSVDHYDSWERIMNWIEIFPGVLSLDGNHNNTTAYTVIVFDSMTSYESYEEAIKTQPDFVAREEYYQLNNITSTQTIT